MNILIWSFKYVPASGVGGRRWRKFGKYLARRGHRVFVVKPQELEQAPPVSEADEAVTIFEVDKSLAACHLYLSSNFKAYERIANKLATLIHKCVGHIDRGEAWARKSLSTIRHIVTTQEIDVLVATGHPCSINYWAAMVKSEFPDIILVQDFRDTWNDEMNYSSERFSGFPGIKERSVLAEKIAVTYADYVFNVSPGQSSRMLRANRLYRDKFHVVTNGYDPEDYEGVIASQPSRLRIVHAGTIRWSAYRGFVNLIHAISKIEQQMEDCDLVIDFYGPLPRIPKTPAEERIVNKFFSFHGFVSPERIVAEVAKASFGMIIFDKQTGYSTKLFDYIALSIPFFTICPKGELYDFSMEHGMPTATYDQEEIVESLLSISGNRDQFVISDTDHREFSIPVISEKIEKLFIS